MPEKAEFKYIRKGAVVYQLGEHGKFEFFDKFKSVSAAKRFTNQLEKSHKGSVRRWESLVRQMGEKTVGEWFK